VQPDPDSILPSTVDQQTARRGRWPIAEHRDLFSFRLGTTSYIVPDDILPNVRALAEVIDDIELVVFESDEVSNLPPPVSSRNFGRWRKNTVDYTLHLPMDVYWDTRRDGETRRIDKCLRVIDRFQSVNSFACVSSFQSRGLPERISGRTFPVGKRR
jgi:hypothetical protein